MKSLQLQSCVHADGFIECALFEVDIADPGEHEVQIEVEAAPINPSDLGLMFGIADTDTAEACERNGLPAVRVLLPPASQRAMATCRQRRCWQSNCRGFI